MKQRKAFSDMLHTTKGMSPSALKEPSPSIGDMTAAPRYVSASRVVLIVPFDAVYLNCPNRDGDSPWQRLVDCSSHYACGPKENSTD